MPHIREDLENGMLLFDEPDECDEDAECDTDDFDEDLEWERYQEERAHYDQDSSVHKQEA